jgi:excisionase family DNA binding protein
MDKLLLTPEQAADVLSIGRTKLYELLATGELTSIRLGGSRRIPADAIRQFVADLRTAPAPGGRDYLNAS